MDWRWLNRWELKFESLDFGECSRGEVGFSIGLRRDSVWMESVEKAFGLKSRGDEVRRRSAECKVGASGDRARSAPLLKAAGGLDEGDIDAPRLTGSPLEETGERLSSGFAMRRPPRD